MLRGAFCCRRVDGKLFFAFVVLPPDDKNLNCFASRRLIIRKFTRTRKFIIDVKDSGKLSVSFLSSGSISLCSVRDADNTDEIFTYRGNELLSAGNDFLFSQH